MNTYYTLIKVTTNVLSDDNLTIGLLVYHNAEFKIGFSKSKTNIAKTLLAVDDKLLDAVIKDMIQNFDKLNHSYKNQKEHNLLPTIHTIDETYLSYLSKYSNGFISFSTPKAIAITNLSTQFDSLFKSFVDSTWEHKTDYALKQAHEQVFYERIDKKLIQPILHKVHTHIKLGMEQVPTLLHSFELDCIGKNGVLLGAKSISFDQSKETIHRNMNTYVSIIAHLSKAYHDNLKDNQFFLIADEPETNSEAYHLWNRIRKEEHMFRIKTSEESEGIAELILSKNATKFLEIAE
jgi:hypothetical protein